MAEKGPARSGEILAPRSRYYRLYISARAPSTILNILEMESRDSILIWSQHSLPDVDSIGLSFMLEARNEHLIQWLDKCGSGRIHHNFKCQATRAARPIYVTIETNKATAYIRTIRERKRDAERDMALAAGAGERVMIKGFPVFRAPMGEFSRPERDVFEEGDV